jgi:hypothetical protein
VLALHVVRATATALMLAQTRAIVRCVAHSILLLVCVFCPCRNDPGGTGFKHHHDGKHLCYRSTTTDESLSTGRVPVCLGCGTSAESADKLDGTLDKSQFYRCYQTAEKECVAWVICRQCMNKCDTRLRARSQSDGGLRPPVFQPLQYGGSADAAAAATPTSSAKKKLKKNQSSGSAVKTDLTLSTILAAHASQQAVADSTDSDDENMTEKETNPVWVDLTPFAKQIEKPKYDSLTDMHYYVIAHHPDLRAYPHAQMSADLRVSRRVELGASNMYWASYHAYVTMEVDLVYLELHDDYDINTMPLIFDPTITGLYDPDTKKHGCEALNWTRYVRPQHTRVCAHATQSHAKSMAQCFFLCLSFLCAAGCCRLEGIAPA